MAVKSLVFENKYNSIVNDKTLPHILIIHQYFSEFYTDDENYVENVEGKLELDFDSGKDYLFFSSGSGGSKSLKFAEGKHHMLERNFTDVKFYLPSMVIHNVFLKSSYFNNAEEMQKQ